MFLRYMFCVFVAIYFLLSHILVYRLRKKLERKELCPFMELDYLWPPTSIFMKLLIVLKIMKRLVVKPMDFIFEASDVHLDWNHPCFTNKYAKE